MPPITTGMAVSIVVRNAKHIGPIMPTMRRRKQFEAEIHELNGRLLTSCFVIADIETTIEHSDRFVNWHGMFTSLTDPKQVLDGSYLMQPTGSDQAAKIEVIHGALDRLGITSDEYEFRGQDDPPDLP